MKNICRSCKSLNTRTTKKESYRAKENYVTGYKTTRKKSYNYTDEYGNHSYTTTEHNTPTSYGTRDVIDSKKVYRCSVCNSMDFENRKGRAMRREKTESTDVSIAKWFSYTFWVVIIILIFEPWK